jgi:HEAT repeat protein
MYLLLPVAFTFSLLAGDPYPSVAPPAGSIQDLARALKGENPIDRMSAAKALGEKGPEARAAIPDLVEALKDRDILVRMVAARALARIGKPAVPALVTALRSKEQPIRHGAAEALDNMGPDAAEALPQIIDALKDADAFLIMHLSTALAHIGRPAVPFLVKIIETSDDNNAFDGAASAIRRMGPEASDAVAPLTSFLMRRDKSTSVCSLCAANALAGIGRPAVPGLIEVFKGTPKERAFFQVRAGTANALGTIGVSAAEAAPVLADALRDTADPARPQIAFALCRVRPGDQEGLKALQEGLQHRLSPYRSAAARYLGEIGPGAASVVPSLARATGDEDEGVRESALVAIGRIGRDRRTAVGAAVGALADREANVRKAAVTALGLCLLEPETAVPALVSALGDAAPEVRCETARALREYGEEARSAAPALAKALEDPNELVRTTAAKALTNTGVEPAVVVPVLTKALKDARPNVRKLAASAMELCGSAGAATLASALNDRDADVRQSALMAFARVGADKQLVLKSCTDMATAKDPRYRVSAIESLAKALPEMSALPIFRSALKDANSSVRRAAADGLAEMGPTAREAMSDLQTAVKDPDGHVRIHAALALKTVSEQKEPAVSVLHAELANPDTNLRIEAAAALLPIADESTVALRVLGEICKSTKFRLEDRIMAVKALGTRGARVEQIVPLLRQALSEKEKFLKDNAIAVLASLGPAARAAGPDLVPFLNQPVVEEQLILSPTRSRALRALRKIDPELAAKVSPR